ncbi:membrane-bound lytic murein transglycosylase D [Yersinia pekkanenii]|nr:membrane-bound lytic murein transglycosylase D [Yersinia pekkanenii]
MTEGYRKKYEQYYGPRDEEEKQRAEAEQRKAIAPVNAPYILPDNQQQARLTQLEAQYDLPATILDRVYQAESGRGKNLLSPKGAQGPFQFMPPTGRDYGLNSTEDRMDFNKSSEAAAKYLSDLLKMFDGDVNKAVASYNWGQGNVKKHGLGKAPAETRNYLQKIMPGLPAIHPQPGELAGNAPDINTPQQSNSGSASTPDINASTPASINTPQQSDGGGADQIASAIAQAMRDNKSEVELTIIDSRTGERRVIAGSQSGKVATSMNL